MCKTSTAVHIIDDLYTIKLFNNVKLSTMSNHRLKNRDCVMLFKRKLTNQQDYSPAAK